MRRVSFIYWWRKHLSTWGVKVLVLALLVGVEFYLVSFGDVLTNMMSVEGPRAFYSFWSTAFLDTEVVTQGALLVSALMFGLLVRDLWRQSQEASLVFKTSQQS